MLTVKECLDTVKVSKYTIFSNHVEIGVITRDIVNEKACLIFSTSDLLNYLDSCVLKIIPVCFVTDGFTSCNLVLDYELPFD